MKRRIFTLVAVASLAGCAAETSDADSDSDSKAKPESESVAVTPSTDNLTMKKHITTIKPTEAKVKNGIGLGREAADNDNDDNDGGE